MPYASGRVFHDADSHVMEPSDWLAAHADASLRDQLGAREVPDRVRDGVANARARQGDALAVEAARKDLIGGPKGWVAYGAFDPAERAKALDDLGFSRQLVFATSSLGQFRTSKDLDALCGGENLRFKDFVVLPFSAQMFLAGLIYDGLFDRIPELRGGVIEFGAAWVPGYLKQLDLGYRSFSRTDPLLKALSMKPSEFIRKHIKFTPFPGEDAGALI